MRLSATLVAGLAALAFALPARAEETDPATQGHIRTAEELRGLKFKKDPTVKYWKVEQLKKMMKEEFDEELPEKKAKEIELVLQKFRLLPKDYDLRKEYLELMLEQIAGFYHPKKKILCLIEGKNGGGIEEEVVTIHELDHAMQDQHFDLTRLQDLVAKNDDMTQALKSLVEGEATYIMMDHMFKNQSGGAMGILDVPGIEAMIDGQMRTGDPRAKKLNESPLYIRETLIRPYIDGFKFCMALMRQQKGWDSMNAVYADLPASTEQVLHPERYITRDMPQKATLPKEIDGLNGWTKVEENTLGELGTMLMFHTVKPKSPKSGKAAAEGWDGDTYRVLRNGESTMLMWATVWDTEIDAREFAVAYSKLLKVKYEHLSDLSTKGETFSHESEDGQIMLSREGRNVFIVEGGSEEEAAAVMTAIVDGTEFKEIKKGLGKK